MRPQFGDIAQRTFAAGHEKAAGAMQIVPLGFVAAIAIEHLHAMIFPVRHINPAIGVAGNVVCDVELAGSGAGPAPGK